jgi:Spy/CpxP family protein refolding chaperone
MKKRNIIIIVLISLFVVAGLGACKRGRHFRGFDKFDQEAAVNRIASHLDLTESQKTDLNAIAGDVLAKAKEMHADHEAHRQEFAEMVLQESISRETVDRLMNEKFDRMKALTGMVADRLIEFHATLTPEQRTKIVELMEKHGDRSRCMFR